MTSVSAKLTIILLVVLLISVAIWRRPHALSYNRDWKAGGLDRSDTNSNPSAATVATVCPACPVCNTQDLALINTHNMPSTVAVTALDRKEKCRGMQFGPTVKRLTIQVGAHYSPIDSTGDDHVVLSFEPQLKIVYDLHQKKRPNVFIIAAAVSTYDGLALFDMANSHSQSASLNSFTEKLRGWSGDRVVVPVIRLQTVLECLEQFTTIEYLLCDAQGSDLDVMKGAGPLLKRFKKITMEVQVNKFKYYESENSKADVIKYMNGMGFKETSAECNGVDPAVHARDPTICEEENVTFMPIL